jgi:stage IV sporulation protein FB
MRAFPWVRPLNRVRHGKTSVFGRIRLHPLFILLVFLAIGVGLWRDIVILFLLVMLHEIGHAAMAHQLGYDVEEVSLLPFGGVAKLSYGQMGFIPRHEALIAIAGPFVNMFLATLAIVLNAVGLWSDVFSNLVVQLNLWIAVFNLLPGLPLDGGRVLRAARSRTMGFETATREAFSVSLAISVILLLLGSLTLWAGYPHFGMLVLGVFLFVSAVAGRRQVTMETIRFLDTKRRQTAKEPRRIRSLVSPDTVILRDVVKEFAPDRYHMIYVQDKAGTIKTILEEDELLAAVFEGRWLEPLGQLIE